MRITPMDHSSTQRTQSAITGTYQGRGRCSSPINQKASLKQVWSASMTVYGRVGYPGSASPDALEHSQGRDGVRRSKAVPGQRRRCNCFSSRHPGEHIALSENAPIYIDPSGLRLQDRALPHPERHGTSPGHYPGLKQRKSQRRTRPLATTQSWNQSATKAMSPSKEKSQHQPGLITRGHRVADPQLTLRVSNNTRLVARPRRATKTKKNGSHSRRGRGWPNGALVGVSLASPLRPREEAPPRRRPRPTNSLRAMKRPSLTCSRAKRRLTRRCRGGPQGRSGLAGQISQGTPKGL